MGALPRLKKKDELHYRKGSTNETRNCQWCSNFIRDFDVVGIGGIDLGQQGRCKIMGLGSSRRYRIQPDNTCDAQHYQAPTWIANQGVKPS